MFAFNLNQRIRSLDELKASVSSAFKTYSGIIQDVNDSRRPDKLQKLEKLSVSLQKYATMTKNIQVFRDSIVTLKNQMRDKNSVTTEDEARSMMESNLATHSASSAIAADQADVLRQLNELIKFIKDTQAEAKAAAAAITDANVEFEEEDIIVTHEEAVELVDPLTKKKIENPVKNSVCGHIYEKSTIMDYINSGKARKCPMCGCLNKGLKECDLIDVITTNC